MLNKSLCSSQYSNTNYLILGKILECISNQTLSSIVYEQILQPYGLNDSYFSETIYSPEVLNKKIIGYYNDTDVSSINPSNWGATACMLMNADDVMHWVNLLFIKKTVLEPKSLAIMLESMPVPYSLGRPEHTFYGLGIFVTLDKIYGEMIWYVGLTAGYSSSFLYLPKHELTIVGQINQLNGNDLKISNHDLLFPQGELMQTLLSRILFR